MVNEIRKLVAREAQLRRELRDVSGKLSVIRAALGMRPEDTPKDYNDSENPEPYVLIRDLVVGAVNSAEAPVNAKRVASMLSGRGLTFPQVQQALIHAAMKYRTIVRVARGLYAPLNGHPANGADDAARPAVEHPTDHHASEQKS